jgi:hypothetical protein
MVSPLFNKRNHLLHGLEVVLGVHGVCDLGNRSQMMACFRRSYLRTSAKDGPAALGLRCSSFFFLLEWRIVSDLDVAAIAIASPSDFVPNGGKGSHDRSTIIDNASGLDHVSMIFCGLLFVKENDRTVILFF